METVVKETLLPTAARELLISVRAKSGLAAGGSRLGSNKPKLKMVRNKKNKVIQMDNMLTF